MTENNQEIELNITDYLKIIWKHRWAILLITIITTAIIFLPTLNKKPVYESSSLITQATINGQFVEKIEITNIALQQETTLKEISSKLKLPTENSFLSSNQFSVSPKTDLIEIKGLGSTPEEAKKITDVISNFIIERQNFILDTKRKSIYNREDLLEKEKSLKKERILKERESLFKEEQLLREEQSLKEEILLREEQGLKEEEQSLKEEILLLEEKLEKNKLLVKELEDKIRAFEGGANQNSEQIFSAYLDNLATARSRGDGLQNNLYEKKIKLTSIKLDLERTGLEKLDLAISSLEKLDLAISSLEKLDLEELNLEKSNLQMQKSSLFSSPSLPLKPNPVNTKSSFIIGILLGLFIGIFYAFIAESWRKK